MDINQVTEELDALFAQEKIDEIPQFLESHIAQAIGEGADDVLLTLYNEIIGFYRETGQYDLSIDNCHKAINLMDDMGIQDTIPYATTLLNAANAHRAAGLLQESLELYNQVRPIYVAHLAEDDMYFANFYNNLSLLYQEMNDFASAKDQLVNALYIVTHKPDKQFEVAVTQANLANTCIELGQDEEAKARAEEAIRIFEELGVDDAHYSAALSALGSLYYMDKDYTNALNAMEKSRDCVAKYLGTDNIQYQRLSDNIEIIRNKIGEVTSASEEAALEENAVNGAETEGTVPEVPEMGAGEAETSGTGGESVPEEATMEEPQIENTVTGEPAIGGTVVKQTVFEGAENEETAFGEAENEEAVFGGAENEEAVFGEAENEKAVEAESVQALAENMPEKSEEVVEYAAEDFKPEITGLELCRLYYEECGRPMIAERFRAYESVIAVGLVGQGSDCFGFDDTGSRLWTAFCDVGNEEGI